MSISKKYGRTYHYPFSKGTTSDDRINDDWYNNIQKIDMVGHFEKMDGENTCIKDIGVFSRSHAAPTRNPWAQYLKPLQEKLKGDLEKEGLEIFGENIYAIHSIEYLNVENHFFVFGMRKMDMWLSWEEVKYYTDFFELQTVPLLGMWKPKFYTEKQYQKGIENIISNPSELGSIDAKTKEVCNMEGLVTRNIDEFPVGDNGSINSEHVFKWVREGHVKTDEHWSKNWERTPFTWEREAMKNGKKEKTNKK